MEIPAEGKLSLPALSAHELERKLRKRVPELERIARCDIEVLCNRDSAHVGPDDWVHFADRIRGAWPKYDGIVLLHGTDTLAYTASALSFLLRPCKRPVVITGAMRPLSAIRTDARRNLISAVEIAARGPASVVNRVSVFFDDLLLQGNRARKRSATEFGAFESPRSSPLARVGTKILYEPSPVRTAAAPALAPRFSREVALLHATPGFPARAIADSLLERLEGLVLVVFPSGTAPTHEPEFVALLRKARKLGVPVVAVTEGHDTGNASAAPSAYAAGKALLKEGAHWAGEMTPECAFVKASLILGQKRGRERFASLWRRNFASEF